MNAVRALAATIDRDVRLAVELVAAAQVAAGRHSARNLSPDFTPVHYRAASRRPSSVDRLERDHRADAADTVEFAFPIRGGRVSDRFGMRLHPVHGDHRHHAGLDVAAPTGTPVHASAPGAVTWAARQRGYGLTVELRHANGKVTRYAHLSEILVEVGEEVERFHVIGLVGATGTATGPHLHFEVLAATGDQVDPELVLGRHRR